MQHGRQKLMIHSFNPSTRGRICRLGTPTLSSLRHGREHDHNRRTRAETNEDDRVGTEMIVRLKWGQTEYKGTLESIDSYMNVLLRDTEEFIDGKNTGSLGLVLIRYASFTGDG